MEAARHEVLRLAEQAVDADVDVGAGHLDESVGVEDKCIPNGKDAVFVDIVGLRGDPEGRTGGRSQGPPTRSGLEVRGGRVPGRTQDVDAGPQIDSDVYGGREAVAPPLPQEVGGQELLGPQPTEQAAHGTRQQERSRAGGDALAGDVAHHELEQRLVGGAGRHHEVAAERRSPGRAQHDLRGPAGRERRECA